MCTYLPTNTKSSARGSCFSLHTHGGQRFFFIVRLWQGQIGLKNQCTDFLPRHVLLSITEKKEPLILSTHPAQSCACCFSPGLEASSSSFTEISSVLICSPDHDPVSVGSGFGSPPTSFMPQKIGYLAKARLPYFVDTPTAPNPF